MGNYISCTLAPPLMRNAKATRVVFPTGEVKQFKEIVKAAELMLENPNYFLTELRRHRRRHGGALLAANSAAKRLSAGKARVIPDNGGQHAEESSEARDVPRLSLEGVESGFRYRLSYCRSRKPVLETINEEPIRSR
ncbi:hypothetical protein SESBI_48612 [Sesbania bispinosa]|nr:hypothetical protein SESBI_48612 [Sesbania bispinosa]